ncbi:MAG: dihydroxyacetone kinase phosphoryl donor subunit DhaM [Actinomycetaceae bacterium]|nr:dihydroxyacetone kinase phosphoryl donor subunit DhaM [Actinomycetaceae bacterium]MDY6082659.1 dihydroxyacetone kinase phosphoryl donor subunit DhaM [Actinomycetaceae bacterium]
MSVGIVVVSHSHALAQAAVDLAMIMVHNDPPAIQIAAGIEDGTEFGTDAMAVMDAIDTVDSGDGVIVFTDLGSAVMSADMAVEMTDAENVVIVAAPFVEGLLAAVVTAATGASLDDVVAEAKGSLAPKFEALHDGDVPEDAPSEDVPQDGELHGSYLKSARLINTHGLHARPASEFAQLAAQFDADIRVRFHGKDVSARSPIGLATLSAGEGADIDILATGADAERAVDALVNLVTSGFGDGNAEPPSAEEADPHRNGTFTSAQNAEVGNAASEHPEGVSAGRVVGILKKRAAATRPDLQHITDSEIAQEKHRVHTALTKVVQAYIDAASHTHGESAQILKATADFAADPTLIAAIDRQIDNHVAAPRASWDAIDQLIEDFRAAGSVIAQRVPELLDIRTKLLAALATGTVEADAIPHTSEPFIFAAQTIAPADLVQLENSSVVGIVMEEGGPTSHASLLARSMGIPAIVGSRSLLDVPQDTPVLIDGADGTIIVNPNEAARATARTTPAELVPLTQHGATADGVHISLLANVGSVADAQRAATAHAEGIGLFRTEFAFLGRTDEPSITEQVDLYEQVAAPVADTGHVVIRTLDAGSDKPIPFLNLDAEANPALGVRGLRTARTHPDVLNRQLTAIARAVPDAWVMAPMITTAQEARDFAATAHAAGIRTVGVMIETPAAAIEADQIFDAVDFVSVGTNDLGQYTMAVDRQLTGFEDLHSSHRPALLRLLRAIGQAASRHHKPWGVCGEAAGDPTLAPVLAGLGVSSLSMNPRSLAGVARALADHTMAECEILAAAACDADDQ